MKREVTTIEDVQEILYDSGEWEIPEIMTDEAGEKYIQLPVNIILEVVDGRLIIIMPSYEHLARMFPDIQTKVVFIGPD